MIYSEAGSNRGGEEGIRSRSCDGIAIYNQYLVNVKVNIYSYFMCFYCLHPSDFMSSLFACNVGTVELTIHGQTWGNNEIQMPIQMAR